MNDTNHCLDSMSKINFLTFNAFPYLLHYIEHSPWQLYFSWCAPPNPKNPLHYVFGWVHPKNRARQGGESNATEPEILIRDSWRTRPTRLPCQRFVIMVAQHYSQVSICSSSSGERKMSGKEVPRGDTIEQTIRLFYKLGGHDEMMRQCHKT